MHIPHGPSLVVCGPVLLAALGAPALAGLLAVAETPGGGFGVLSGGLSVWLNTLRALTVLGIIALRVRRVIPSE